MLASQLEKWRYNYQLETQDRKKVPKFQQNWTQTQNCNLTAEETQSGVLNYNCVVLSESVFLFTDIIKSPA